MMTNKLYHFAATLILGFLFSATAAVAQQAAGTLWWVDFVRTKDGQYENYLKTVEKNWAVARREMQQQEHIISYKVLAVPPDSLKEWNVMLMTEYASQKDIDEQEKYFQTIFADKKIFPSGLFTITGLKSADLREIKFSKVFRMSPDAK